MTDWKILLGFVCVVCTLGAAAAIYDMASGYLVHRRRQKYWDAVIEKRTQRLCSCEVGRLGYFGDTCEQCGGDAIGQQ